MVHEYVELQRNGAPREAAFEHSNHGGSVSTESSDLIRGDDGCPVTRLPHAVPRQPCQLVRYQVRFGDLALLRDADDGAVPTNGEAVAANEQRTVIWRRPHANCAVQ